MSFKHGASIISNFDLMQTLKSQTRQATIVNGGNSIFFKLYKN